MEFFDIVDGQGNPTGETVERSEAHAKGIRHRTAHVWIVKKECGSFYVLLQKRAMIKDSFPGQYDTSSAGHIPAGAEPLESAVRELGEELGIAAAESELEPIGSFDIKYEKEFRGKMFRDNEYSLVYVYTKPVDREKLRYQPEEVETADWFEINALREMLKNRDPRFCVPRGGFALIDEWCAKNGDTQEQAV